MVSVPGDIRAQVHIPRLTLQADAALEWTVFHDDDSGQYWLDTDEVQELGMRRLDYHASSFDYNEIIAKGVHHNVVRRVLTGRVGAITGHLPTVSWQDRVWCSDSIFGEGRRARNRMATVIRAVAAAVAWPIC
eukprot:6426984-Pyramimonas_sp.AAC.1